MKKTYNVLEKRLTMLETKNSLTPNAKKLVADCKDLPHLQKPIKYLLK
jgi:hypothetical protein